MTEPSGDICVLSGTGGKNTWTVSICAGRGKPHSLGTFEDRAKACEFALDEARRRHDSGQEVRVHFPDDCPCYFNVDPHRHL